MLFSHALRIVIACVWLSLLCTAEHIRPSVSLERRMDASPKADRLFFDDLPNTFFWYNANPPDAKSHEVVERFPHTFFFKDKPLFLTDSRTPLSRSELHRAYNAFGKFQVAETETPRFLTFFENDGRVEQFTANKGLDSGLDKYVRHLKAVEKIFGNAVATTIFGPMMKRAPEDVRGNRGRYLPVPWSTMITAKPIENDIAIRAEDLREHLSRHNFVKIASKYGQASTGIRFDDDGMLTHRYFDYIHDALFEFN